MILLFGDSWARHSTKHVVDTESENSATLSGPRDNPMRLGYRHWKFDDTFVEFQTDDWFNSYFKKNPVINFAEFGNTNSWIIENLFSRVVGISNFDQPLNIVVFQTDPLRIFAPRADFTNIDIVWPNFEKWCKEKNFDYHTQDLDALINVLLRDFYIQLLSFESYAEHLLKKPVKIFLVGGVSKVHSSCPDILTTIIPSVTEFFGYTEDLVFESHLALHRFLGFWMNKVSSSQKLKLLKQWHYYDQAITKKTDYWSDNPQYFAGRHLTSQAFSQLANHIENCISLYYTSQN